MESLDQQHQEQQQNHVRLPSQSPIRRPKRRKPFSQQNHHHHGNHDLCCNRGIIISAFAKICLRYYPFVMTLPVVFVFLISWSKLQSQLHDMVDMRTATTATVADDDTVQLDEYSPLFFLKKRHKHENDRRQQQRHGLHGPQRRRHGRRRGGSSGENTEADAATSSNRYHRSKSSSSLLLLSRQQKQQQQQQPKTTTERIVSINGNQTDSSSAFFSLLQPYDFHHPSLQAHPLPVHFIVGVSPTLLDSHTHTLATKWYFDGLERSDYLQVVAVTYYHNLRHVWTAHYDDDQQQQQHQVKTKKKNKTKKNKISQQSSLSVEEDQQQQQQEGDNIQSSSTSPKIWVVDWSSLQQDCHALQRILETEVAPTMKQALPMPPPSPPQHSSSSSSSFSQQQPYYLLLLDSSGSSRQDDVTICHSSMLTKYFDHDKIRLAKRSIVQNRYWMDSNQWVHVGEVVVPRQVNNKTNQDEQGNDNDQVRQQQQQQQQPSILHMPLVLRDDFMELVYNVTITTNSHSRRQRHHHRHHGGGNPKRQRRVMLDSFESLASSSSTKQRFADVTFFWRKGDYSHYGKLRRKVSEVVQSLNNVPLRMANTMNANRLGKIRTLVRMFGDDDGIEQGIAQLEYVQQLQSTKIVVIAQRDEWEDDYGMLEAMACGAMVITDTMLTLPPGFVNGTHVIMYDSAKSLRDGIHYYLSHETERWNMVQAAWHVAMEQHRSWHRIESLVFGKPLTETTSASATEL